MIVIVLERVPASVRGELSRWMLELHTGVFVGRFSAMVRDTLWAYVCRELRDGAGLLVYHSYNDQGFVVQDSGLTQRIHQDAEGFTLVRIPSERAKETSGGISKEESH